MKTNRLLARLDFALALAGAPAARGNTGRSIDPQSREYQAERVRSDLAGEYRFHKHLAVFAALQNVTDNPEDRLRYGPTTAEYARLVRREQWGSFWTIGLKGSF